MKMPKVIVTTLAIVLIGGVLSGCNGVKREDVGLIGGGVAGGVIGGAVTDSTAGAIVGTLGGAYLGREIARNTR